MNPIIITMYIVAALLRLGSLAVSIRNEKALKGAGAIEYGEKNSRLLATAHVLFYTFTLVEGILRKTQPTTWTTVGIVLYVFAMISLCLVWRELGRLWTVKLIIAPDHVLNQGRLFRWVRHPNYFLSLIPELIGLALIMGAWMVLLIGLPLYLIVLGVRIVQEERVMKRHFPDGGPLSFPSHNPVP
jgi:isoprenylcysteine carboxyl methyltransferase (ICMT) family protein YpbQ